MKHSRLMNSYIVVKHQEKAKHLFEFPNPKAKASGDGYVNLDGYLICPLEMFTKRQLRMAVKKYTAGAKPIKIGPSRRAGQK